MVDFAGIPDPTAQQPFAAGAPTIQPPSQELSQSLPVEQIHPEQVMRSYTPTWRDRLGSMLFDSTTKSPEARNFVGGLVGSTGLGNTGASVADFVPGVGQALGAQEAASQGDYKGATLAALPLPPAMKAA